MNVHKNTDFITLIYIAQLPDNGIPTSSMKFIPLIDHWVAGFDYKTNVGPIFYFHTNFKAPNARIVAIDINKTNISANLEKSCVDVIPEHPKNVIMKILSLSHRLIYVYLEDAKIEIKIYDLAVPANEIKKLKLPGIGSISDKSLFSYRKEYPEFFFTFT